MNTGTSPDNAAAINNATEPSFQLQLQDQSKDSDEPKGLTAEQQQTGSGPSTSRTPPATIILHYSPFKAAWDWLILGLADPAARHLHRRVDAVRRRLPDDRGRRPALLCRPRRRRHVHGGHDRQLPDVVRAARRTDRRRSAHRRQLPSRLVSHRRRVGDTFRFRSFKDWSQ